MLCIISSWLIYFKTRSLHLLTSFTHSADLPIPFPSCSCQSLLCIYELGFYCCFVLFCWFWFLDSTYKWNHMVFVFLVWLISLSIMPSRSIHVLQMARFQYLLWLSGIIFCVYIYIYIYTYIHKMYIYVCVCVSVYIKHLLCSFIPWWAFM